MPGKTPIVGQEQAITWGAYAKGGITRYKAFKAKTAAYDAKQKQAQAQWDAEQKRLADAKKAEQDAQAQARYNAVVAARERDLQAQREREQQQARSRSPQGILEAFAEGFRAAEAARPAPVPVAPPINCTSTRNYNTTRTTCY